MQLSFEDMDHLPYPPEKESSDPVVQSTKTGLWYFWEETWTNPHGPFKTSEECRQALEEYCKVEELFSKNVK